MGKRNRERVSRISAGLEKPVATPMDPKEKAARGLCPFPGCPGKPLRAAGAHGFCAAHEKFVADLCFIFPHIQWQPAQTKSGLILPGSPDFTLGTTVKRGPAP